MWRYKLRCISHLFDLVIYKYQWLTKRINSDGLELDFGGLFCCNILYKIHANWCHGYIRTRMVQIKMSILIVFPYCFVRKSRNLGRIQGYIWYFLKFLFVCPSNYSFKVSQIKRHLQKSTSHTDAIQDVITIWHDW